MAVLDLIIILFLVLGFFIGSKQGFTKSLVLCVGYIVITIIAFLLKDILGNFLILHFPFFDFWGLIKGAGVFTIAIYQTISFGIIFTILTIIMRLLLVFTTIFDKILELTIVLGPPSKILGGILGVIRNYIIVFTVLYITSLPNLIDNNFINSSKYKQPILENTPILSSYASKTVQVLNEFMQLKTKYNESKSPCSYNLETLDLFLKYDIVKPEIIRKLLDQDKLHIKNIDTVLKKYEKN